MHGERDVIIPVGAGRCLAQQLPQARFQLFPGLGHAPFSAVLGNVLTYGGSFVVNERRD